MKGLYFMWHNKAYVVLSEAMMHPEGQIQVVAKRLTNNEIEIFDVSEIKNLEQRAQDDC